MRLTKVPGASPVPVHTVRVFVVGGGSPDESMIDSSPSFWAVRLERPVLHEEDDARTAWNAT